VKFHSRFFQSIFAGSIDQTREREKSESAKGLMRERGGLCSEEECKCDRYVLLDSNGMNVVLTVGGEVFFSVMRVDLIKL
jgi:hypothetical protein